MFAGTNRVGGIASAPLPQQNDEARQHDQEEAVAADFGRHPLEALGREANMRAETHE
jgi:hypothetical protein